MSNTSQQKRSPSRARRVRKSSTRATTPTSSATWSARRRPPSFGSTRAPNSNPPKMVSRFKQNCFSAPAAFSPPARHSAQSSWLPEQSPRLHAITACQFMLSNQFSTLRWVSLSPRLLSMKKVKNFLQEVILYLLEDTWKYFIFFFCSLAGGSYCQLKQETFNSPKQMNLTKVKKVER